MKSEKLSEIVQLDATLGVMVGLGLLIYEIRENNAIAYQQSVATNFTTWSDLTIAEMQLEFADAFSKSMTNAGELTLSEKVILNAWLTTTIIVYQQEFETSHLTGSFEDVEQALLDIAGSVPYLFGNKFSRDWYAANRHWIPGDIVEVIDRELESIPLGADLEYFDRLGN
jgi:hypothetical protein